MSTPWLGTGAYSNPNAEKFPAFLTFLLPPAKLLEFSFLVYQIGHMAIIPSDERITSYWVHFAVQAAAFSVSVCLVWALGALFPAPSITLLFPVFASATAVTISFVLGHPWWWKVIHSLFLPGALLALSVNISPEWYLWSFIFLFLVFRSATTGRVPLYFSGKPAISELHALLRSKPDFKFIDLGAGIGSVTLHLALAFPQCEITGVENSVFPWLLGRLRTFRAGNHHWIFGNFWNVNLGKYDVVYAFLSPAPMARIWEKARKEMRPASLFITNTFRCPNVEPTFVIKVAGKNNAALFCYEIPATSA